MMRKFTRAVIDDFAEMVDMIEQTLAGYWRELGELGEDPARTRQGIVAACSVMLATTLALAARGRIRRGGRRSARSCR